jgi:predicted dehydrogenase
MGRAKTIGVAQIGHKFIGKAHAYAYSNVGFFFDPPLRPVKTVLCGVGADLEEISRAWGFASCTENWKEAVERDDVEIVDICAPSKLHKEITLAAAAGGKHVFCEKPLAMSLADAREMLKVVEAAGIKHTVGFNYRKVPALAFAKKLVETGYIGKVFHFRGLYAQDWLTNPDFPLAWRLRREAAGGGSSWDLGAHVVDLARYLVGEIAEVTGNQKTFTRQRPVARYEDGLTAIAGDRLGEVDVDDSSAFLANFENGAVGIFEVTRYGTGHRNQNQIEIYGSEGGIIWRGFEKMNELEVYSRSDPAGLQGYRTVQIGEADHPYVGAYWPVGHIIGFGDTFTHEILDFLSAIAADRPADPSFEDGVRTQAILAAVDLSVSERSWVAVADL